MPACSVTVVRGMCRCAVDTTARLTRGQHPGRDRGELIGTEAEQDLGQQLGEPAAPSAPAAGTGGPAGHLAGQHGRDLLVRPVLEQPGEQQVPGFQQRQVLLVVDLAGGQQPGRLEVEQRRGDHRK